LGLEKELKNLNLRIGVDVVVVKRMELLYQKWGEKGWKRFLTSRELEQCFKPESVAGIFAVKEAFSKAVGSGIGRELSFHQLEVLKNQSGKPILKIDPEIREKFQISQVDISISHDGGIAVGIVVLG